MKTGQTTSISSSPKTSKKHRENLGEITPTFCSTEETPLTAWGVGGCNPGHTRMKNELYAHPNLARILFLIQKSRKSETVFVEKRQVLKQSERKQRLSWSVSCRPERPPSTCDQGLSLGLLAFQVNNPIWLDSCLVSIRDGSRPL